jgi:hypothetical protein
MVLNHIGDLFVRILRVLLDRTDPPPFFLTTSRRPAKASGTTRWSRHPAAQPGVPAADFGGPVHRCGPST